jgi:hypothetical protein
VNQRKTVTGGNLFHAQPDQPDFAKKIRFFSNPKQPLWQRIKKARGDAAGLPCSTHQYNYGSLRS